MAGSAPAGARRRIDWGSVNWPNTVFLGGTLLLAVTAVPAYIMHYGLSAWQVGLFLLFFAGTGLSITLGYHRLYSHLAFKASWPVRLFTLLFGAAAFENSVLRWAADHRRHHKFVDEPDDPYDISRGFLHAHVGWILFRLKEESTLDGVKDLLQDGWVVWQDRHYRTIAVLIGFVLPTLLGGWIGGWTGALGAFLMAGVARVVFVHHMTFFINSLCHTLGRQPYSVHGTARDSSLMAWFTFGEGYHNFHHTFQHDYRNGVKPWQFDPTKWCIWLLNRVGLATQLRRVPEHKILLAEIVAAEQRLATHGAHMPTPVVESMRRLLQRAQQRVHRAADDWEERKAAYRRALEKRMDTSRETIVEFRREFREAAQGLRLALREARAAHFQVARCFVLDRTRMLRTSTMTAKAIAK